MSEPSHQEQLDITGTGDDEEFLTSDDVLEEVDDDGDHQMDEDDSDEEGGEPSQPPADSNFEQSFSAHGNSVFTVSGHPSPSAPIAVSGGEDDLGYIWDITDGEVIVKLSGHTDSVTSASWSHDGEMVATGGMDGKVRVWKRVGTDGWRQWEFVTELTGPDEVMFLRWHPKGNVLLAGSNDGTLWLWQLPSGNTMQVFAGHSGPVQTGEFTPDGKRIVTADGDGNLIYWDPRSPTPVFKLSSSDGRFNLEGITSLGINPSSTLAVVGGMNGGIRVVSLAKGQLVGTLSGHSEGENSSIEAVTFVDVGGKSDGPGVAVTGGTDGKACIWDLATMRLRATLEHEDAITSLLTPPSPKSHTLISASADKTLKVWDARTGNLLRTLKGHSEVINSASLGLGGDVVLGASDDGLCLVWTTEKTDENGMVPV
ncbi:WD40-repeat-containing domain protein [Flagelloscypha sp. PMI_526]|nr:WD40-repeat-containing domain protein [Flagelloscypha sp. PMI_526]